MERNLNQAYVHVIKNGEGFFNPGAPAKTSIDCRSVFDSRVTLNTTTHGNECGSWEEGEENSPKTDASTDTIATVKMRRLLGGQFSYIYITPADYATFITTCNSCCNS